MTETAPDHAKLLSLTSEIVSAHTSNNHITTPDLIVSLQSVYAVLQGLNTPAEEPAELVPAVPIKKSVTDDHIICLEDGRRFKMLKRHLRATYNLTPDEYRSKWGLAHDYPMVAPAYAKKRQTIAKKNGLGRSAPDKPKPRTRTRKKK